MLKQIFNRTLHGSANNTKNFLYIHIYVHFSYHSSKSAVTVQKGRITVTNQFRKHKLVNS